ncbi:hypothetical protein VU06_01430 [Desulfobulbus sp. F3]|nr:hypothetical protein [Desulfobulbus sp. F3]
MSEKSISNELISNFQDWNNLIADYIRIECQAEELNDTLRTDINNMLASILSYSASCVKIKDVGEIMTSTSRGDFSLFSLFRSICSYIRFGIYQDEFYMTSSFSAAPYLKKMNDAFWIDMLSLSSLGRLNFLEEAEPQIDKKSEAGKIMRHNKSQIFRIIRNYLFLEITEGDTADLGTIELYWPIKTPLITILQNATAAFEKMYRINYALYRAEYLCFRNEVRKSQNVK